MKITSYPTPYGSVYRPACVSLAEVQAPEGIDIDIMSTDGSVLLGTKRIYSDSTARINVAPYLRRLLAPVPLCDRGHGIITTTGRDASCVVKAAGVTSSSVTLCGGTEDSPLDTLLSAAPPVVKIAPGERDEMSVLSGGIVEPVVTIQWNGATYTDSTMGQKLYSGVLTAVIDPDTVCHKLHLRTGAPLDAPDGFSVRLQLRQAGRENVVVERRYVIDRSVRGGGARRLAWLNRFGVVDYHTFPVAEEFSSSGERTRIVTSGGFRTVATSGVQSLRLLSEPCDEVAAEWLSEIFSSPLVWMVDGANSYERVEVAAGGVVCSPDRPTVVSVTVSPAAPPVSRKF
jgi:hypothetical protein